MTDEKQIEEMAKVINEAIRRVITYERAPDGIGGNYYISYEKLAKELLKKYQPKLPENAVVLTREEYDELLKGRGNIVCSVEVDTKEVLKEHDKTLANDIITMFQKMAQNWASADIVNDTAKRLRKLYEVQL